jgi:hypothetical protein
MCSAITGRYSKKKMRWLAALTLLVSASALNPFPLQDVVEQALSFAASAPSPAPLPANKADFLAQISSTVEALRVFQNKNTSSPFYGKVGREASLPHKSASPVVVAILLESGDAGWG